MHFINDQGMMNNSQKTAFDKLRRLANSSKQGVVPVQAGS